MYYGKIATFPSVSDVIKISKNGCYQYESLKFIVELGCFYTELVYLFEGIHLPETI